jgi:hypothetical protein
MVLTTCAVQPLTRGAMLASSASATGCCGLKHSSCSGSFRWRSSAFERLCSSWRSSPGPRLTERWSRRRPERFQDGAARTANAPLLLNAQLASYVVAMVGGCALHGAARVGPSLPHGAQHAS